MDERDRGERAKRAHADGEKNRLNMEFSLEKEGFLREIEGLKLQIGHFENDKRFFVDQIDDLKSKLLVKTKELEEFEKRKILEIERAYEQVNINIQERIVML